MNVLKIREKQLLLLVSQGDTVAFGHLFKKHYKKVYAVAHKFTHSEVQAEDLVQDVFLKVWLNKSKIAEVEDFDSWLYTIARNETYTALKRSIRVEQAIADINAGTEETRENTLEKILYEDYYEIVQKVIATLPKQQRTSYKLAKEQGMSIVEIANKMNIRPDTVKEYLATAKKTITKHIKKNIITHD